MTDARITQACLLWLEAAEPMLTFDCQLWRIERRDGTVFAYTSHDEDIDWRGDTYQSCKSLQASAIETGAYLQSTGNLDLNGIITDDGITERDIFGGLFDGAEVEIWRFHWKGNASNTRLTRGIVGKISPDDQMFKMEALTDRARLEQQSLLEPYTAPCRWEKLGDARCKVDLGPYTETGTVTALASLSAYLSSARRIFSDSTRGEADQYWALGELTWNTGANAGLVSEIKDFAAGQFVLWEPMPYDIQIGDDYTIKPGCDRLSATCKAKFNNYINYGGFEDIPGKDSLMQTPEAKD